jgi:DNA-binding beta-propeller fold protein YncE/mono/diheme cytochrome c family protein
LSAFLLSALSLGCGAGPARSAGAPGTQLARCVRDGPPPSGFLPADNGGVGSSVALARWGNQSVAYVADEDANAVYSVDVDSRRTLQKLALSGRPAQLVLLKDGRLAVGNRDRSRVELFVLGASAEAVPLAHCALETPADPWGLALTPDEQLLVVTSAQAHALTGIGTRDPSHRFGVDLPREPRGVLVTDDGKTVLVAHAAGDRVSAVRIAQPKALWYIGVGEQSAPLSKRPAELRLRHASQGYALAKTSEHPNRTFVPEVLVDPGDPERRTAGYGADAGASQVPAVAVIDSAALEVLPSSLFEPPWFGREELETACLLPRAAAVDSRSSALLVTCLGLDAVVAYELGAAAPARVPRALFRVPAGPTGIAVDDRNPRAIVWSQFEHQLSVIPLTRDELVDERRAAEQTSSFAVDDPRSRRLPAALELGRFLFHQTGDPRISRDGRACASCHPDGRDDGLTWSTPHGPRRSIALGGRLSKTAPFAWQGDEQDLGFHLDETFTRLQGAGLHGRERRALMDYITSLPGPARPYDPSSLVRRGRAIFESAETGCATCHRGSLLTDNTQHDVGSKAHVDSRSEFDTPSLRYLGGGGPYFHDGRYGSLRELLISVDGKMGRTKHLSAGDLNALEAYLSSL